MIELGNHDVFLSLFKPYLASGEVSGAHQRLWFLEGGGARLSVDDAEAEKRRLGALGSRGKNVDMD